MTELEQILSQIQGKLAEKMLEDLSNPVKCTPQLYNAIIKELERNGIDCLPKAGEGSENSLQKLLNGVQERFNQDYGTDTLVS